MKAFLLTTLVSVLLGGVDAKGSAVKGTGSTTRGWSCCKNTCSWSNKAPVNSPVITCDQQDNLFNNPARRDGCESGGGSYSCSDLSPWAASNELSYGYAGVNLAASNESAWCCSCYSLKFTSGPVNGKQMIVQVVNTGNDLGNDQFDLAIPGGGQGDTQGCTKQFGQNVWGDTYGGVNHREGCDALPEPLKGGCYWRFDWFRNADNPNVEWEKVACPEELSYGSGCRRNDDPVGGKPTSSTPTRTSSAPLSSGTVAQGGQCGGRNYRGPTVCVRGTVCTFVDENSYYCLPDPAGTRTTPTTTATAAPTVAVVWDQCGGRGYTGPTRCQDSHCVVFDEWYSQCQPYGFSSGNPPKTTSPPNNPGWSFTRTRTRWGGGRPTQNPPQPNPNPSNRPTSTKPTGPVPTIAQLYDQCGGQTYTGPTRCVSGLSCVYIDDYYSQCQRPGKLMVR